MFYNNFYTTDDMFGYHPTRRAHFHDGSVDRYLRRKEQEEREAAYARRLYEHRRQQAVAAREEELRRLRRQQRWEDDDEEEDYDLQIVRGRDGNLYYVKRQKSPRHQQTPTITEETHQRRSRQPLRSEIVEEESDEIEDDQYQYESADTDANSGNASTAFEQEFVREREGELERHSPTQHRQRIRHRPHRKKSSQKRRVTVIVEDASDSECESEFDSPWRNRRPSPGESWLEPVEAFYG